jgi:hypothetical protein
MDREPTVIEVVAIGASVVIVLFSCWFFFMRTADTTTMTIRYKEWFRQVRELEDYQSYECHTRYRTVSDGDGGTKQESYRECGWETKTRETNRWNTSGRFPEKPFWPEYSITEGRYSDQSEKYVVHFSDDKDLWQHWIYNETQYDSFKVRSKCEVDLTYFRSLLRVRC